MRKLSLVVALSVVVSLPAHAQSAEALLTACSQQNKKEALAAFLTHSLRDFSRLLPAYLRFDDAMRQTRALYALKGNKLDAGTIEDLQECADEAAWHKKLEKAKRRSGLKPDLLEEFVRDYWAANK